eukprot:c12782_g4_i2.p2 GENE.c12782_g4_i2~~c12782_g4_i2.p2  ORF type:complete len:135 (-),score=16.03 c12782_g4_i2:477-881(-)
MVSELPLSGSESLSDSFQNEAELSSTLVAWIPASSLSSPLSSSPLSCPSSSSSSRSKSPLSRSAMFAAWSSEEISLGGWITICGEDGIRRGPRLSFFERPPEDFFHDQISRRACCLMSEGQNEDFLGGGFVGVT